MGAKRALGRNVAWNTTGLVVATAVSFLVMPFLIATLGTATYGVWLVLGALTSYFGLLDLGVRGAVGRHVALYASGGDRQGVNRTVTVGVAVLVVVGSVAAAAVLVCEPVFFSQFDVPAEQHGDVSLALRLSAINLALLLVFTTFDAVLWGLQRFDWLNLVDIPAAVSRGALTFALVGSGGGSSHWPGSASRSL